MGVLWLQAVEGRVRTTFLSFRGEVECGRMAKGCNLGWCKKCQKIHVHGMKGKHHSEESKKKISKANKGKKRSLEVRRKMSEVKKGKKLSPEHYAKIVAINKSPEKRRRISQKLKGRVSPMKGYCYTPQQKLEKSIAMNNSSKHKEAMRKRRGFHHTLATRIKMRLSHIGKPKSPEHRRKIGEGVHRYWLAIKLANVREFYKLPKEEVFFPSSLKDHKFSREVLIEKTKSYSYYEHNGLREHFCYIDKNGELKVIQGLFMRGEDTESLLIQFQR